jgi:anti-sigma-K factor RskA
MNCDEARELLPAYALGALDAEELSAVEAHLRTCREHDGELIDLRATVFALDSLGGEVELGAGATPARSHPEPAVRTGGMPVWQMAVAAALLLAVFGAGWLASDLVRSGSSEDVSIFLRGAEGQVVDIYGSDSEESVTVGMKGFVRLTDGTAYQLWAIRDGQWLRIGVCNVDEEGGWWGDFAFSIRSGEQVALTIEPQGGSISPTSEPILSTLSQ